MAAKKEPERRSVERRAPPKATPKAAKPSVFNNNAVNPARADLPPDELRKLISEAAYFRAKKRGFAPGHELEDWIQAEAEVMGRLGAPGRAS